MVEYLYNEQPDKINLFKENGHIYLMANWNNKYLDEYMKTKTHRSVIVFQHSHFVFIRLK